MKSKEFIKENDNDERPKITEIDYEDMTPAQQRIIAIGLSQSSNIVPDDLTGNELRCWIHEQVELAKN